MNTLREEIAEIVRKHEPDWEVREEDKRSGIESFNDEQAAAIIAAFQARLPKEKDLYEGMVCHDFEHCITAYDESPGERAEYNHAIAEVKAILGGTE